MLTGIRKCAVRAVVALSLCVGGGAASAATLSFDSQGIASLQASHPAGSFTDDYTFSLAGASLLGATISNLVISSGFLAPSLSAISSFSASIYAGTNPLAFGSPLSTLSFNSANNTLSLQDFNLGFGSYTLRVTGTVTQAGAFYVGAVATTTPVPLPAPLWLVATSLFAFMRTFRRADGAAR